MGDKQHALLSAVKNLAAELGRTPTRNEFTSALQGGDYQLRLLFKNYTCLLQAAGLETYEERRSTPKRKIDNSIFNRDIERHLEEYEPKPVLTKPAEKQIGRAHV